MATVEASGVSACKQVWLAWDSAWENGMTIAQRLEALQRCATSDFVYTNPDTNIPGDIQKLAEYIDKALNAMGNKMQVKHLKWFENNGRCALHWDMMDTTTDQAVLQGWSYGQMDTDGRLKCVADFW